MNVTVTERDSDHLSHEAQALGQRIWEVVQNDQLVGIFHNEADAQAYRQQLLETNPENPVH